MMRSGMTVLAFVLALGIGACSGADASGKTVGGSAGKQANAKVKDVVVDSVDVPAATLTAKGSGAVGSLLCNLGNLLGGLASGTGAGAGAGGIVNALNNLV